jgi:hypothetical protein
MGVPKCEKWAPSTVRSVLISADEVTVLVSWDGQENKKWQWILQKILR